MPLIKRFWNKHHRILVTAFSALFIFGGTFIAIQVAKGYRPTTGGIIAGTGLLAVNSKPEGAQIYIDGILQDKVTDDTIVLNPGKYFVEISKEGFTTWSKNVLVEQELVTDTGAELFRTVPSLTPITFSGAENLTPSPDGRKIAFTIASPSAQLKPGLYVQELSDRTTFFSRGSARLVAENPLGLDFKQARLLWSPDSNSLVASFETVKYLLDPNQTARRQELVDASLQISSLLIEWEQEIINREKQLLLALPDEMQAIATDSAKNLYFSPDGEKLLYTATAEVTLPEGLIPPLPATNSQPESRHLEPGNLYIYDIKEDKNFLVLRRPQELPLEDEAVEFERLKLVTDFSETNLFALQTATVSATPLLQDPQSFDQTIANFRAQYSSFPFTNYQWFPTSRHILINENGSINIIEYDGTNLTPLYSGTYLEDFVYPWPNGDKLIILTNLTQNPALPPNLYAINLK